MTHIQMGAVLGSLTGMVGAAVSAADGLVTLPMGVLIGIASALVGGVWFAADKLGKISTDIAVLVSQNGADHTRYDHALEILGNKVTEHGEKLAKLDD